MTKKNKTMKGGNYITLCSSYCFNKLKSLVENADNKNLKIEMLKSIPLSSRQVNDLLQIAFNLPKNNEKIVQTILDIAYEQYIIKLPSYKLLTQIIIYEETYKQIINNYKLLKTFLKYGGNFKIMDKGEKNEKSNLIALLILASNDLKYGEKKKLSNLILLNWKDRVKNDTIDYLNELQKSRSTDRKITELFKNLLNILTGKKAEKTITAKPQLLKTEYESSKPKKKRYRPSPLKQSYRASQIEEELTPAEKYMIQHNLEYDKELFKDLMSTYGISPK